MNLIRITLLTSIVTTTLAGCAVPATQATSSEASEANLPLMCENDAQCQAMWRRSQVWIAENSGWKIQIATDAIIETYNPPEGSRKRFYRITRESVGGGREQIKIASGCRNPLVRRPGDTSNLKRGV